MKMDSYRRFVRSPLYQRCTLASVEGKLLPQLSSEPARMGSWEEIINSSPLNDKKVVGLGGNNGKCMFLNACNVNISIICPLKSKKTDSNSLPSRTLQQSRESVGGKTCHRADLGFLRFPVSLSFSYLSHLSVKMLPMSFRSTERAILVNQQCGAWLPLQADGGQC